MTQKKPEEVLGLHPEPDAFGCYILSEDRSTDLGVPHRVLSQKNENWDKTVVQLRKAIIQHHSSAEMRARDHRLRKNLLKLGYTIKDKKIHRFPHVDKTRKGNLAEVFLAEYIVASNCAELPIYRLRYNPNVEQSMKGDDVLAFDFSSQPVRILVGEAKFRSIPSKKVVEDIVAGLVRSHQAGLPVSLQFVADRLFETGNIDLGSRVEDCAFLMARDQLDLHYVGLLLSNVNVKMNVDRHTSGELRNLVMISLSVDDPNGLICDCFNGIEEDSNDDTD